MYRRSGPEVVARRTERPAVEAEQGLELHAVAHAAVAGQQPGVGEVEQVLAGHADADVVDPLGCQCPVDQTLVVRVGVGLRRPTSPAAIRAVRPRWLRARGSHP